MHWSQKRAAGGAFLTADAVNAAAANGSAIGRQRRGSLKRTFSTPEVPSAPRSANCRGTPGMCVSF